MRSIPPPRWARRSPRPSSSRTCDYVDIALKEGGRLLAGGEPLKLDKPGHYMSPTLIADTAPEHAINREEVFGPVASAREESRTTKRRWRSPIAAISASPPASSPPR